jgi:hypothetical protein
MGSKKSEYLCLFPHITLAHLNTGRSFRKRGSVPSIEEEEYIFWIMLGDGTSHLCKIMSKYISGDVQKLMGRRFKMMIRA